MARVIGVDIPDRKRLEISLRYLYGVGKKLSLEIIEKLGLNPGMKAAELTEDDIARLNALLLSEYVVEGDLRREVQDNIKRLVQIGAYRGVRHRLGLPTRGQRTRTNSRTRKGRKKTVANKKK